MLLTAWTQTTGDDFEMLRALDNNPQLEAENRALRDKVRYLEAKLQEHTDLLSQIHATSARMQQVTAGLGTSSPATPPCSLQPQILTPPSSVICAPVSGQAQQQQQHQHQAQQQHHQHHAPPQLHTEVIDYKIIAAAGADCNDADAIEIRLAAESLNSLSTSADSDRLEICLESTEQQLQQVKQECSTPLQLIKRRKLENNNNNSGNSLPAPLQPLQYKLPTRRSSSAIKEEAAPGKDHVMVSIGPNNTCVPASVFENINWSVSSLATRKLLVAIFDRETLATHSMTGKPSPAFKDQHKPLKQMLDPAKIQDIIFAVTRKSNASEKEVRNAITTKCADENKMMKIQKGKRCSIGDKENRE